MEIGRRDRIKCTDNRAKRTARDKTENAFYHTVLRCSGWRERKSICAPEFPPAGPFFFFTKFILFCYRSTLCGGRFEHHAGKIVRTVSCVRRQSVRVPLRRDIVRRLQGKLFVHFVIYPLSVFVLVRAIADEKFPTFKKKKKNEYFVFFLLQNTHVLHRVVKSAPLKLIVIVTGRGVGM